MKQNRKKILDRNILMNENQNSPILSCPDKYCTHIPINKSYVSLNIKREVKYSNKRENFNPTKMVFAIKAFSSKLRLFLSGYLYELLENSSPIENFRPFEILIELIQSKSFDKKWISEIPQKELNKLRKNLESPNYSKDFKIYIEGLTEIIKYLRSLNLNNQDVLDMKILAKNLYNKKINLGMRESSLRNTVIEIFDYLKDNFKEFTLSRITRQTLHDDGIEKECGRCHELKPYSEFSMVNKRPYYICKQCELILDMINKYKKKLLVALKLYRGRLKRK